MVIELKVNTLRKRYDFGEIQVDDGMNVGDCVDHAVSLCPKINLPDTGQLLQNSIIHINSQIAYADTPVREHDKVIIMPQITDG